MNTHEENTLAPYIDSIMADALAARHHLHKHPELSRQEDQTSRFVANTLNSLSMDEVRTGVGGYGVIGILRGNHPGKVVALRADMDALPIHEESDLEYRSTKNGVMHACGHDGHTATLLGTAATLSQMRERIKGEVRFLFQPAEEIAEGAKAMCADGALAGVDSIFGLHGWPGMAVGRIGVRSGPIMASADNFEITIKGRGAHAAMPHKSIDPVIVAAHLVTALQTLVSRETSPTDSLVVSVTQINAGTANNIIPETAEMKGTVRCLTQSMREATPRNMERVVAGICSALGASYCFNYQFGTPVTVNAAEMSEMVATVGSEVLGSENVVWLESPSLGAEDFAIYLNQIPGAMFRLGVGENVTQLHTPTYNFGDEPVRVGIEMFTNLALRALE